MWISKRTLFTVLVAVIAALSMAVAVGAFGAGTDHPGKPSHPIKPDHPSKPGHPATPTHPIKPDHPSKPPRRGKPLIKESLAPSQPSDPAFHGASPGAAPWVLKRGAVELKADGKLKVHLDGLVIPNPPGDGTPGPVNTISVSLYCGADTDTAAADTSQQVAISRDGDARLHDKSFTVPSSCLAPVILVHPNGDLTHYIAVDGWRL